jgi:hypothetical protein
MAMIRGLSLTRPWPFAFGQVPVPKRVENRGWKPKDWVGHYIALHAAKSWDEEDREFIAEKTGLHVPSDKEPPHSQIFAVCRYFGCVTSEKDRRLKEQAERAGGVVFRPVRLAAGRLRSTRRARGMYRRARPVDV